MEVTGREEESMDRDVIFENDNEQAIDTDYTVYEEIDLNEGMVEETEPETVIGRIVVIGHSKVKRKDLEPVVRELNIINRFEFELGYECAVKYNYRKLRDNPSYSLILVGPIPHSAKEKRGCSSIITRIENYPDEFPRVVRLMAGNKLKITKTAFRRIPSELVEEGELEQDIMDV